MCCIERWLLLCVLLVEADALCGQLSTVQYLDLDHGASASAAADIDHEPARFTFPAADTTDYKEIDPLKTKALQVTRYEVENTRRRSSDKLMEAWFVHFISLCSVAVSISRMRQLHGCFVNLFMRDGSWPSFSTALSWLCDILGVLLVSVSVCNKQTFNVMVGRAHFSKLYFWWCDKMAVNFMYKSNKVHCIDSLCNN